MGKQPGLQSRWTAACHYELAAARVQHQLWDLATGRRVLTIHADKRPIDGFAMAPDGKHLASAHRDGWVKVWEVATGKEVAAFSQDSQAKIVAYSPDGKRLAAGKLFQNEARQIKAEVEVWNAGTGEEIVTLEDQAKDVQGPVL